VPPPPPLLQLTAGDGVVHSDAVPGGPPLSGGQHEPGPDTFLATAWGVHGFFHAVWVRPARGRWRTVEEYQEHPLEGAHFGSATLS
jgi:hypothetical protein